MATEKNNLDPVELPDIPDNKLIDQYFYSKAEENFVKRYPVWDVARGTPTTELVVARRALHATDGRLAEKRGEQVARRAELDAEWAELRERAQRFRESFVKFDRFVGENEEKRERAERKAGDERASLADRENDIAEMTGRLRYTASVRDKIERSVGELRIYEVYLRNVVDESSTFKSIPDVINRYETLIAARQELVDAQVADVERLEAVRARMQLTLEQKERTVTGLNTIVGRLHSRYEMAKLRSLQWEHALAKIKAESTERLASFDRVATCLRDLYAQTCRRRGVAPSLGRDALEEQALSVKRSIVELKRVLRKAIRKHERESASAAPAAAASAPAARPR